MNLIFGIFSSLHELKNYLKPRLETKYKGRIHARVQAAVKKMVLTAGNNEGRTSDRFGSVRFDRFRVRVHLMLQHSGFTRLCNLFQRQIICLGDW